LVVGEYGMPSVISHMYGLPLSTDWTFGPADVDDYTVRNLALRLLYQVACTLHRAAPRADGPYGHLKLIWDRMAMAYGRPMSGGNRSPPYKNARFRDTAARQTLDEEFANAGFVRLCAMGFDDLRNSTQIFAALQRGMASAEVFSELQDAYSGRRLRSPFDARLFAGGAHGAAFISRLLHDMRDLPADWQRVALLREMSTAGLRCMVPFGTEISPIPSNIADLRLYHPGQDRAHREAFKRQNMPLARTALLAYPSVEHQFREAASVAEEVRLVVDRARAAAMPHRLFATAAWAQWYNLHGFLDCDPDSS
jgi:hypothetical protein